jgi:hypothetical protein
MADCHPFREVELDGAWREKSEVRVGVYRGSPSSTPLFDALLSHRFDSANAADSVGAL